MAMLKYLARTVRLLSGHVDQMAFHSARYRVAQYLLSSPGDTLLCNQEEIASTASISRVTANRILNEFARQGLIQSSYRKINILDRKALHAVCHTE